MGARVVADSPGNVVSRTAGGLADEWKYDAAGLLAREQRAGKPARAYGYHQDDLVTMTYAGEATSYRYWPSGRLASTTEPSGRKKTYAWYDRGLLKTEAYGVGADVDRREYTYDAAGNVATLTKGTGSDVVSPPVSEGTTFTGITGARVPG